MVGGGGGEVTSAVIRRSAILRTGREGGKTRDDDTEITAPRDTNTEIPASSKRRGPRTGEKRGAEGPEIHHRPLSADADWLCASAVGCSRFVLQLQTPPVLEADLTFPTTPEPLPIDQSNPPIYMVAEQNPDLAEQAVLTFGSDPCDDKGKLEGSVLGCDTDGIVSFSIEFLSSNHRVSLGRPRRHDSPGPARRLPFFLNIDAPPNIFVIPTSPDHTGGPRAVADAASEAVCVRASPIV